MRSKRYRLRVKSRIFWRKRAQALIKRIHRNNLAWIRFQLKELKRKRHASAREGFLDGWNSGADQPDPEYGTRYRKGFAEARAQRIKFERQTANALPASVSVVAN